MGAYNDDVLFIHIPKTAGIAVKEWMDANMDGVIWPKPAVYYTDQGMTEEEAEEKSKESTEASKLPVGHVPVRDIPRCTGRELESWKLIVAILRNPYDQQVSQWSFWRDRYARGERHMHDIAAAGHPTIHTWLDESGTANTDFHIWYQNRIAFDQPWVEQPRGDGTYTQFGGYYRFWISDERGRVPENLKLLRMEDDVRNAWPKLLEGYANQTPPLHTRNRSPRSKRFLQYYRHSDEDRVRQSLKIVREKFAWTFDEGHYHEADVS